MATITESTTLRKDPSIWKPPQFDREERWVLPSIVGNVLKEVSETSNVVVGNSTLPIGSFMSGRVVFSGAATGTKSLPTATDIITYLEANYSQLTGRVASATGVTPKVKEIEVEFFNNTAAASITIQGNTGLTLTPTTVAIPAASSAKYKFIIEQTTPVPTITGVLAIGVSQYANSISPTTIISGTTAFGLSAAAPDQLVVFDTVAQTLGYVTNATLPASTAISTKIMGWDSATSTISQIGNATLQAGDVNDNIMGWDTATSTPSKFALTQGTPQLALTRNETTGALVWADETNYPAGSVTTIPIGINATTGVLEKYPTTAKGVFWQSNVAGLLNLPDAATTMLTYDANSATATGVSYAAGVFTVTAGHTWLVNVDFGLTTLPAGAGSFFSVRYGTPMGAAPTIASNEYYRMSDNLKGGSVTFPVDTAGDNVQDFTTFCVTYTNASGGVLQLEQGGGTLGIRNSVKITRLS